MASISGDKTVLDLLNELIELDYDAIEAYEAAVGRVVESRDRGRITGFLEDHRRQVKELSALVRNVGGEPPGSGDLEQLFARGKVAIGALFGDRLVLEAMKAHEAELKALNERIAARPDLPERVRAIVTKHLAAERKHHDWIVDRLDSAEGLLRL